MLSSLENCLGLARLDLIFYLNLGAFQVSLEPRGVLAHERVGGEETGEETKRERTSGRTRYVLSTRRSNEKPI